MGRDLDVAVITPGGAPRVLQDVVVGTILSAVANGEHHVVKACATVSIVKNTASVRLERHLVSLNGNNDGTLRDGSLESRLRVLLDIDNLFDVDDRLGLVGHALTSCHGVVLVTLQTVLLEALEHVIKEATATGEAAVLGLSERQALQLTSGNFVRRLDDLPSEDDTVLAHLTLVLDGRDDALGSPVDTSGEVADSLDGR